MRRLPGSKAYSIFSAVLLIGATSCGLRTTLDYEPGAPGQTATNTGTSTGKIDAGAPGAAGTPDAGPTAASKADAPPATTPITPDAAQPIGTTPDAAIIRLDARTTPTTADATVQPAEVGSVPPSTRGDASVGGRTDVGAANRDTGVPSTQVTRDAGPTNTRPGADAGPGFTSPDLGTRVPGARDGGFALPTTATDAGLALPTTIDGGFTFGGRDAAARTRADSGRAQGAAGQN
jgi:hypothetical protein